MEHLTGTAAGVPFVARAPAGESSTAIIAWHLLDAPRTESAFAAALPLDGLDAWRIYLGLPMTGTRLPKGGMDEFMRLGAEDSVLNVYGPIFTQAADEFDSAWAELRERLGLDELPAAVVGGSLGGAVAAEVLSRTAIERAVLINPVLQLEPLIEAIEQEYGVTYPWSDAARDVARRIDFVARADELADRELLLAIGEHDAPCISEPAAALDGRGRVTLETIPGLAHALADEPGVEPAPQTPGAAAVEAVVLRWLSSRLA